MILMVAGEFLDYLKLPAKTVGSVAMATVASVDTPTSRIILGWAEGQDFTHSNLLKLGLESWLNLNKFPGMIF